MGRRGGTVQNKTKKITSYTSECFTSNRKQFIDIFAGHDTELCNRMRKTQGVTSKSRVLSFLLLCTSVCCINCCYFRHFLVKLELHFAATNALLLVKTTGIVFLFWLLLRPHCNRSPKNTERKLICLRDARRVFCV